MDVHIKGSKNPTKWFYNSGMSNFFLDGLGYHHLVFPSPPICALCPPILWPLSRWAMANTWNSHQLPSKWKKIKRQKEHTKTKVDHCQDKRWPPSGTLAKLHNTGFHDISMMFLVRKGVDQWTNLRAVATPYPQQIPSHPIPLEVGDKEGRSSKLFVLPC